MSAQKVCPWPQCEERIPRSHWGCPRHWFNLPEALRRHILMTWNSGNVTAWMDAMKVAREWAEEHWASAEASKQKELEL